MGSSCSISLLDVQREVADYFLGKHSAPTSLVYPRIFLLKLNYSLDDAGELA